MAGEEPTLVDLVEMLRAEQRGDWLRGKRILTEAYVELHPRLFGDATCALQMVYNEVLLREENGEDPQLDEYKERFPQFIDQLTPLFEVHRALAWDQLLDTVTYQTSPEPSLPESSHATPAPWPTIAGFEILGELGRGGMGVVYKARQVGLNRVVALKMILAGNHADPAQVARFRAEAKAVARLQHPNIVQIHEVGEQEGRPYFALEFVNGGSLDQALNGTPQPARLAAGLMRTLARAMHAAHEQGIVHRDLKPANILLQGMGVGDQVSSNREPGLSKHTASPTLTTNHWSLTTVPKITDFGLAKQLNAGVGQTSSGTVMGTASYMAPEQANGKVRELGPAADVYALGAILYELLVGRPPFKAATALDTLRQVLSVEPVSLSHFHLKVPRDLDTICLKCLQKEPRKRYTSALDLAEDLERFLADQPIQARRTGTVERTWRWCRRNPAVAALLSSVAALLFLLAVGASIAAQRMGTQLRQTQHAEHQTKDKLWRSLLERARAARLSRQAGQRFASLEALTQAIAIARELDVPRENMLELRNESIACLALADLRFLRPLQADPTLDAEVGFDAALERYAQCDAEGNVLIRFVVDDREIRRLHGPGHLSQPRFSPNGRIVVADTSLPTGRRELVFWDLQTGDAQPYLMPRHSGFGWAFSPNSGYFASGLQDGSISVYELASRKEVKRLGRGSVSQAMVYHPNGRQLAVCSIYDRNVLIYDLDKETLVKTWKLESGVQTVAWSANGQLLAAGCDDHRLYVWDMAADRLQSVLDGHQNTAIGAWFIRGSDLLVSAGWDGTVRLWDPVSGKELVRAFGEMRGVAADKQRLILRNGSRQELWELVSGSEYRTLYHGRFGNRTPRPDGWTFCVDFSPDEALVASAAQDGVRFWDSRTFAEVGWLPGLASTARFHPRGTELLTYGTIGLQRWPIRKVGHGENGVLRIGPPQMVSYGKFQSESEVCYSPDGKALLFADLAGSQAIFQEIGNPARAVHLGPHPGIRHVALSVDGRWAATGTWNGAHVKVWNTASGKPERELPGDSARVRFSPDGQWLATTTTQGFCLWRVGSWEMGATGQDSGSMAFSPDGTMLAIGSAEGKSVVKLIHVVTGAELATLEAPDQPKLYALCFSPDGSQLAAATLSHTVQFWDLRRIRQQLVLQNLDWDLPPYDSFKRSDADAPPVHVEVQLNAPLYAARASSHWDDKQYAKAIADYQRSLELDPDQADVCNALAWSYVTCPLELQNPTEALSLIQKAITKKPADGMYQNTLGVVHYRMGSCQHAADTLQKNVEKNPGKYVAFDWIVLAMCHQRLGQTSRARDCYFRAVGAFAVAELSPDQTVEWMTFRTEAEKLLAGEKKGIHQ